MKYISGYFSYLKLCIPLLVTIIMLKFEAVHLIPFDLSKAKKKSIRFSGTAASVQKVPHI